MALTTSVWHAAGGGGNHGCDDGSDGRMMVMVGNIAMMVTMMVISVVRW